MYIDDQKYKANNKLYRRILLRNSYRKNGKVCHDTIANLSNCSDQEVSAIKFALENKDKLQSASNLGEETVKTKQGLSVGAVWLLFQLAKRLGIVKALGNCTQESKLSLWMIIATVIGSVSRLSASRLASSHAVCDILNLESFCEDDLYKAMDWVNENQQVIEQRLFKQNDPLGENKIYLYDVTSSYFEGDQNELADYGYNRDKKRGKKQIVIGLLTDKDGRPISTEVFRGNTSDMKTFKSQVDKVANRFGIKDVTFVGDRGMIKGAEIKDLSDENFHYITAITKAEIETLLKKEIIQLSYFDETICEVSSDGVRYVCRRNPIRADEVRVNRENKMQLLKNLCDTQNEYLEKHKRAKIETARDKIIKKIIKLNIDKFIDIKVESRKLLIEVNDEFLKLESRYDGCYVIKTDLKEEVASKEEVHDRYKSLSEVEWAFRTMKTVLLHIRGIYVRKAERTRAHVFIIGLSYLLAYELRRLWQELEITIEEGIAELSSLCATQVNIGDTFFHTIPEPRDTIKQLLEKAKITMPDVIPCKNQVVYTRKKLTSERKALTG